MNDFALFIKSEFIERQKKNPQFSMRAYSKWLGLSPAQISQIMSGKRSVTLKSFNKISEKLGLSPYEKKKYMYALSPEKATTKPEKKTLDEDQFKLISDWYHLAILSLTRIKGANPDPRWISQHLGISSQQANEAISRLVRMGCLQLNPFKQIGEPFEVVSNIPSAAIRRYHQQHLQLAQEKIETIAIEKRQFQSMSFPLSPSLVPKIKNLIDQLLDESTEIAKKSAKDTEEVYSLNIQLYPISKIKK